MLPIATPRSSLQLEPEGDLVVARFRCDDQEWRAVARREVERARGVRHPALVPVRDLTESEAGSGLGTARLRAVLASANG